MSYDRVERALIQHALDVADAELARARAEMEARVTALKESWSSGFEQHLADSAARQQAIREGTREWIKGLYADDGDQGARTDVRQIPQDASAPGEPVPPGAGSAGPPTDPYAAELAEAERIRTMPMQDWAEVRKTLIRTGDGLFR